MWDLTPNPSKTNGLLAINTIKPMETGFKDSTSAFDRTVHQLCKRIDFLESEVEYWKIKYEEEKEQREVESNKRLEDAKKGVANAIMFALSVRDDEHGNLVLPKEERKSLAKKWNC